MEISEEVAILGLRAGLIALLYLFLFSLVALIHRELRFAVAVREAASPQGRLIVLDPGTSGRAAGQAIPLGPVTQLGRSPDNAVILDDEYVSAIHARVTLHDGRWWLRDLDSTNGTLVNGAPVLQEKLLQDGDEIQIGRVLLRLAP